MTLVPERVNVPQLSLTEEQTSISQVKPVRCCKNRNLERLNRDSVANMPTEGPDQGCAAVDQQTAVEVAVCCTQAKQKGGYYWLKEFHSIVFRNLPEVG
jgi:hypothetical protein